MYQIKKITKIAILMASIVSLSACSSLHKHDKAGVDGADKMHVRSSGLGAQGSFGDEGSLASANKLKAPYDQTYYFEFDRYDVSPDDVASVDAQANYLLAHSSAKLRLEGYADERGSREYNIALGWKRAKAVADELEKQGVTESQIAMVSYGKEKPAAFGHDEASYRLNRRVNLVYEAK